MRERNPDGSIVRIQVGVDCSEDELITEQNHKADVDINNIIKRHGMDMIAKTAQLQQPEYLMDDIPGNDFQEAMLKVTKAQQTFDSLPHQIRKQFDNNPAEFLDFIHNKDNADKLVEMGLAERIPVPEPIKVVMEPTAPPPTEPETPPA